MADENTDRNAERTDRSTDHSTDRSTNNELLTAIINSLVESGHLEEPPAFSLTDSLIEDQNESPAQDTETCTGPDTEKITGSGPSTGPSIETIIVTSDETVPTKVAKNRCEFTSDNIRCKRKVRIVCSTCKCGGKFCEVHVIDHNCTYDYKSDFRENAEKKLKNHQYFESRSKSESRGQGTAF